MTYCRRERTLTAGHSWIASGKCRTQQEGGRNKCTNTLPPPLSPHASSRSWPRDSSNNLAKRGYRTQNMPDEDADSQPAASRVVNEQCEPNKGHGLTPSPTSVIRINTPSSSAGRAATRTEPPWSRLADFQITHKSRGGLKGKSKVYELRSDSQESCSQTESEGGSAYAKMAWWVPEQVKRADRQTRACSTAKIPGVPVPETRTSDKAIIPDSEEASSSHIMEFKDIKFHSLDPGTINATSPILGRGPQGQNRPLSKPKIQLGVPIGTVSGEALTRPQKTGSGNPLPRLGMLTVRKNKVGDAKAGGDSVLHTSRRTSTPIRSSESPEGTRGRGHWESRSTHGGTLGYAG